MSKRIIDEAESRMGKTLEDLRRELATVRTGRASVHLLDNIQIDYYGTLTPINQMACLLYTSPSPRDLSTSRMPSSA